MPRRNKKAYNRPRKLYDSARIAEENLLIKKYGLKNKREIWRADFAVSKIRASAKKLITAPEEKKQKFIEKQKRNGFNINTIADVLSLQKEDYLKRRLQSILVKKGIARTPKQARQFVAHKHITIKNNIINAPSHITTIEEESNVALNFAIPIKNGLEKKEKEILKEIRKEAEEAKAEQK